MNIVGIPSIEKTSKVIVVGIAGGSGAGKTTLASRVIKKIGAKRIALISHDAYYCDLSHLTPAQRTRVNYDHPKSLETRLMIKHIKRIRNWQPIDSPVYDFVTHTRTPQKVHIEPKEVIILEGNLILHESSCRNLCDLKIFVETDADVRFIRRLRRDTNERGRAIKSVIDQYLKSVRPMHVMFVQPSRRYADIVISGDTLDSRQVQIVTSRLEKLLDQQNKSSKKSS